MKETLNEHADRKNEKIIEIYNQRLEEEGLVEKKIDTNNIPQFNKAKNLVA